MSERSGHGTHGHGDVAASFVLIFPALLAYQIGVLFAGNVNGADVVTRALFDVLGRTAYLAAHALIAIGFLLWIRRTNRWSTLHADIAAPVLLEAALYALTLGAAVTLVLEHVLGLGITAGNVVNALGAGVHEELVFRLAMIGGFIGALRHTPLVSRPRIATALAIVLSALVFATAHHLGPRGEPWTERAFAFRCLAGVAFALVFWFRSLAHAVYAHIFYDVLVYWQL